MTSIFKYLTPNPSPNLGEGNRRGEVRGYLVLEVLLASVLFVIFATGGIIGLISALNFNRSAKERVEAVNYAQEALEAARSIRNQGFSNLTVTTGTGLQRNGTSGVWEYDGSTGDTLDGRYQRTLAVEEVDPNTKRATVNVNWNFTPALPLSVSLSTYLTNWKAAIAAAGGLLVYGDAATTPKYREYDQSANSFSGENGGPAGAAGRTYAVKTSPTKHEAVAGYVDATGTLRVICFENGSWTGEWSTTVGGTGNTRRFDIGYETNSGDVLVLYSTNAGTNELAFRTKAGTAGCGSGNWSGATAFDSPATAGVVHWVKIATDRRAASNLQTAIWADANSDLQGAVWNGNAWVQRATALETSLEVVSAGQDVDDFDIEYESLSGDVMVVWANSAGSNGTNGVRYATCSGGTAGCSWSGAQTPPTWSDDATNLDISANPVDNQIIFASIGNAGSDLQYGRWNGTGWTNLANRDTSCTTPAAGYKLVTTGWLVNGSVVRGIVVYADQNSTSINYRTMTPGTTPTWSNTIDWAASPALSSSKRWNEIAMDPGNPNQLMLTLSNVSSGNRLYSKRLEMTAAPAFTWTNADGGAALETAMGQAITAPFSFEYWHQ